MPNDELHARVSDVATSSSSPHGGTPGRATATSRLAPSAAGVAAQVLRLMRKPARDDNGVAANAEDAVGRASSSSGHPLPDDARARFEGSLGADLSSVRVHRSADSEAAADTVGARAYTVGQDIHFGAGQYAPSDPFGLHLLAHEVAHTVQQSGGAARKPQCKLEVSTPGDALELEADRAADAMVSGESFAIERAGTAAPRLAPKLLGVVDCSAPTRIWIRTRSVNGWKAFLKDDVNSQKGSIELNGFLAIALRKRQCLLEERHGEIGPDPGGGKAPDQLIRVEDRPTDEESTDLVEALLTNGRDTKLSASQGDMENGDRTANAALSELMSEFIGRFGGAAIKRLGASGRELDQAAVAKVTAFSDTAQDVHNESNSAENSDPVQSLVAASLGSALGATVQIVQADRSAASDATIAQAQREAFILLRNSSLVIRGCLDHMAAVERGRVAFLQVVVATAAGALAALSGGASVAAQMTSWGFASGAGAFFSGLASGGSIKPQTRKLIDDFKATVNDVAQKENVLANTAENIKNAFEQGMNY